MGEIPLIGQWEDPPVHEIWIIRTSPPLLCHKSGGTFLSSLRSKGPKTTVQKSSIDILRFKKSLVTKIQDTRILFTAPCGAKERDLV